MYAQRKKDKDQLPLGTQIEAPCETCRVELFPANFEAARVYQMCQDQLRTAGADNLPFAPDLNPVFSVMKAYRVKDEARCLEKVKKAFSYFISKSRQK